MIDSKSERLRDISDLFADSSIDQVIDAETIWAKHLMEREFTPDWDLASMYQEVIKTMHVPSDLLGWPHSGEGRIKAPPEDRKRAREWEKFRNRVKMDREYNNIVWVNSEDTHIDKPVDKKLIDIGGF